MLLWHWLICVKYINAAVLLQYALMWMQDILGSEIIGCMLSKCCMGGIYVS